MFASIEYDQEMHFGYLNLQDIPCTAYRSKSKPSKC